MNLQHSKLDATSLIGQLVLYSVLAAVLVVFANWPVYHQLGPDQALIKLSIVHEPQFVQACRQRTPEELAKLPPNMRAPMDCPRGRSDIRIQLEMDGKPLFETVMHPTGLSRDGVSTVYRRFEVKAGTYRLAARMNDNLVKPDFNHVKEAEVTLRPGQVLVVDFNPDKGGLFFQ